MKIRALVVACTAAGLATMTLSSASAVTHRAEPRTAAALPNPCHSDPQMGDAMEKISGPGPQLDGGYGLIGGTRAGSCVKVVEPRQQGHATHTVVVRSDGEVQRRSYADGSSNTRMAHKADNKCRVTVTETVTHRGRNSSVYQAKITIRSCKLYG